MNKANDIERIFCAALEIQSESERESFLRNACGQDSDLRAAVDKLLSAHWAAGNFMPQTETDTTMENQVGTVIGHYKLREKIGEGGMGEVWVAKQSEPVKRRVALKLIKTGMDSKSVLARFEQERQALAMMDHPNIARVLDGGLTPAGQPFFVMELVNGLPLDQFCDGAKLPLTQRLELFVPICQAVQHAHQKGIVHRDLKPANILVTMIDGKPVPKIIDFGLAKAFAGGGLTEETMTQFGAVLGTLAYMSPEQASFSGDDVDTRADIYSLGVILYELLTGLRPIDHKRLQNAALNEMVRIIQEEEPSKPSTRLSTDQGLPSAAALRQTEPSKLMNLLRGELDWVVMKCLEKERDRRYETANGLGRDIQRFLSDQPVEARPASTSYRLKKLLKRNKGPVIAASLLLVSLLAGITGTTWAMIEANRQAVRAQDEADAKEVALQDAERQREMAVEAKEKETGARKDAEQQTELAIAAKRDAEQISEFLKNVFESPDPNRYGRWIKVVDLLDTSAIKLKTGLANQPAKRFKLQAVLGKTFFSLGLYDKAIPLQQEVRDYYLEKFGKEHPDTLTAALELARSYRKDARYNEALQLAEQVVELREKLLGPEHADTLVARHELARIHWDVGRRDEALKMVETILPRMKEKLGAEHTETLNAMLTMAGYYSDLGRYVEAISLSEEVVEIRREELGEEHPDTMWAVHMLAYSHTQAGHYDKAIELNEQVLESRRKVLGAEHPDTLSGMGNLALTYNYAGNYGEAFKLNTRVLELKRRVLGDEDPATLLAMRNLAIIYMNQGRLDEAIAMNEECLELSRTVFGDEHPNTLSTFHNLALCYQKEGRLEDAIKMQKQCLRLRRKVNGPEHPDTLKAIGNLAYSYRYLLSYDEAIRLYEECLKLSRKVNGPEHPNTLGAILELALSYKGAGRLDEAITMQEELVTLHQKLLGQEDRRTLGDMTNLAKSYMQVGRLDEAIELQERALEIKRRVLKPNDRYLDAAFVNLAKLYIKEQRSDEAIKLLEELLKIRPEDPNSLNEAAGLFADSPDGDGNYPHAERAVELARKACELSKDEDQYKGFRLSTLGFALLRAGRSTEAIEKSQQSIALKKQQELDKTYDWYNWLFIAMAHWKLDNKDEAQKWYDKALAWKEENPDELKVDPELQSFFAEAAELMGKQDPKPKSDAANSGTDSDDTAESDDKAMSEELIKK